MNYIDLINNFWKLDVQYNFTDKEIALYFYLLKVCNSTGWKNPFGLSNSMTIAKFGWGRTSFDNAKNGLKKAGVIDFKGSNGRGMVYQYKILDTEKVIKKVYQKRTFSEHFSEHFSKHFSEKKPATSIDIDIDKDNKEDTIVSKKDCDLPKSDFPNDGEKTPHNPKDSKNLRKDGSGGIVVNETKVSKTRDDESFKQFWTLYDKKVGNIPKIRAKWCRLSKATQKLIFEHIPRYVEATPDKRFRKNPETYLNSEAWNDEIINSDNASRHGNDKKHPAVSDDELMQSIQDGLARASYEKSIRN